MNAAVLIVKMVRRAGKVIVVCGVVPTPKRGRRKQLVSVIQRPRLKVNPTLKEMFLWQLRDALETGDVVVQLG